MLIVPPAESLTELPSPYNLRHKIILKHKKLPEGGQEDNSVVTKNEISGIDILSSVKNGIMHLQNPVDNEWEPHFFLLTRTKLFYTKEYRPDQESDSPEDEEDTKPFQQSIYEVPNEELHLKEKWFHGHLKGRGKEAERLLMTYSYLGIFIKFIPNTTNTYSYSNI